LWTSGETDSTDTGLGVGWHFVTITDDGTCSRVDSIYITQPTDSLSITFTTVESHCSQCDGIATVHASGGTPIYTFAWDDPTSQVDSIATALCSGPYNVTVTDNNSCTISGLVLVQDSTTLVATASVINHITCNGTCDGSALGVGTFGNPPYNYSWNTNPIQINDTAIGLCDTLYILTILDADLCNAYDTVTITDVDALDANLIATDISCFGLTDGEIYIQPTGGLLPLDTIIWYDLSSDTIITGLSAGYYSVTIEDQNGCIVIDSAEIIEPTQIMINFNIDAGITCYGDCDGVISSNPSGGTVATDYTYEWDDLYSQTTEIADSLCDDFYTLTLTDDNNCSITDTITLSQPDTLGIYFGPYVLNCGGDSTEVTAYPVNGSGTPPYTFAWENGDIGPMADSLVAGTYYVTMTDLNTCFVIDSIEIADTSNIYK